MELGELRLDIDAIDEELTALFLRRMALSGQVAQYKQANALPVLDDEREKAILDRAEATVADEALKPVVRRFFQDIMSASRQLQQNVIADRKMKQPAPSGRGGVAYLGPQGSFSYDATVQVFGESAKAASSATFEEIVESVASGNCCYGMLPVENSLTGGIFGAIDLLSAGGLTIVGETVLSVRHCLLGLPGATLESVKTVLSHPQPLEQCRQYIRKQGLKALPFASTAGAAQEVARRQDFTVAAIASESAGLLHGLAPLVRDIQDNPANYTRFVIVAARAEPMEGANKISAIFVVEHRPGTLYGTLKAFADRGINLLNLISRPMPGSPWQYCFHMDFDGSLDDANVQAALAQARASCRSIIILGNYRKWER